MLPNIIETSHGRFQSRNLDDRRPIKSLDDLASYLSPSTRSATGVILLAQAGEDAILEALTKVPDAKGISVDMEAIQQDLRRLMNLPGVE